jgi:glycosyltransferase involved in cell wall biosynthesis
MESYKFTIIIPNYNNAEWLNRMFESICAQTYKNYEVTFVDDCSTDESLRIAEKWGKMVGDFCLVKNKSKRWNGGSRNAAMRFSTGEYTLFMDSDDWFADSDCLAAIAEALETNNSPDLLRLSYCSLIGEEYGHADLGGQNTIASIVHDQNVACWTKCVKTEKLVKFPENTLMEDVTQHIAQLDNVETVAAISKPIIVWNRNNSNSCSRDENLRGGKWKSSLYRYYADLLELEVENPECRAELEHRRAVALDNIKNDRFVQ